MVEKKFVNGESIRNNSFRIASLLLQNEFIPTIIYAVLRGGVYVANPIHEYYLYRSYNVNYGVIRATSYKGSEKLNEIKVEYFAPDLESITANDRILIAEDIIDTRRTLARVLEEIESKTPLKRNQDEALKFRKIVVVCNDYKEVDAKDWKNKRKTNPDYYVNQWKKDDWIHYTTHELLGLNTEEIKEIYGDILWK